MISYLLAFARRLRTFIALKKSRKIRYAGADLHIGARSHFWAPDSIIIGKSVYIGKDVLVESNAQIGDFVLIANRVAFLGRHDHDFRAVGIPVRFSPWVGSKQSISPYADEKIIIEDDVWLGFGAIVLSGVTVGRGAIVAAGSVITRDVEPYMIVAGNPARVVGKRFYNDLLIADHEIKVRAGRFEFSERGYDHWRVESFK